MPEVVGHEGHNETLGAFSDHTVSIVESSWLGRTLGSEREVKSHHHQAPATLGRDLTVTAVAPDGTTEAIEHSGARFAVGVLWHPEEGADKRLFTGFVDVCRRAAQPA